MNESNGVIRDARKLGIPKMLILGLQHMFAMFGATILVPILVNSYFVDACGEGPSRGLTVSVTLFCAGFGTLLFHLCAKFKRTGISWFFVCILKRFRRLLQT